MTALRWGLWLAACVAAGIALGLAGLPGSADAEPAEVPSRAIAPGLREAAALPTPTAPRFTPRGEARFSAGPRRARPRIAIVIDDLGLSRSAFERVNALPGPLTLAFLPYGEDAQTMLDAARPVHETIMHLPTEPSVRVEDAGPDMLPVGDPAAIRAALDANFAKLSGFSGVNNHTGSLFTGDPASMAVLLEALDAEGLYFLDSVTTSGSVARRLARREGWRVVERDVFLDDDYAGKEAAVRAQLAELERIALAEGQAVAIGHPYAATMRALGPWLVTAQARGFDLVTVGELVEERQTPVVAGLR